MDVAPLRERNGEADRGLTATAAPPLRGRLDSHARQPGCQDVLVAPLSAVHVEIVKNQAVRAAVVVRPPTRARISLRRFKEAKSLLEKTTPLARRLLGESHDHTLRMRWNYAEALYRDDDATLDDLREAVTTLEEIERIARRVFGSTHPLTTGIEDELQKARAARSVPCPR